ncbi:MAG: hypothetical protein EBT22_13975, partial [Chloroflexi bacterium]|nr:hypothetical protein [Chloroflexota bacterium]
MVTFVIALGSQRRGNLVRHVGKRVGREVDIYLVLEGPIHAEEAARFIAQRETHDRGNRAFYLLIADGVIVIDINRRCDLSGHAHTLPATPSPGRACLLNCASTERHSGLSTRETPPADRAGHPDRKETVQAREFALKRADACILRLHHVGKTPVPISDRTS